MSEIFVERHKDREMTRIFSGPMACLRSGSLDSIAGWYRSGCAKRAESKHKFKRHFMVIELQSCGPERQDSRASTDRFVQVCALFSYV